MPEGYNQLLQLPDALSADSRLLVASDKKVRIRRGASEYTPNRQTSSSISASQAVWNLVLTSSSQTIIDPYMYAQLTFTVTVSMTGLTGTDTVQNHLQNNFSLRQYPLASITQVSTIAINNQSISCQPALFVHPLAWSQDYISNQACFQSATPIMPDQASSYNQASGSLKNALATYFGGSDHYSEPRGSHNGLFVTSVNNLTTWTFSVTLQEPIINSFLQYDPSTADEGLAYVNKFDLTLNFVSNLSRMFSADSVNAAGITSIAVTPTSAILIQNWLTSPVNMLLPPRTLRSYNTLIVNQTIQPQVNPGAQAVMPSQNYSFNQIPTKIWLFVNDSQTDISTGFFKADYCFSIQAVSILFNNRTNLLANYTPLDLYNNCSASEGARFTFVQSQLYTGSVLEIDPAKLFGLSDVQAPGMLGTFNFSCIITATNISPSPVIPNLNIVQSLDTVFETGADGQSRVIQGWLKAEDVIRSNSLPAKPSIFSPSDIYGGGVFDDIKNFFSGIGDFIKRNKVVSSVLGAIPHPAFQVLGQAAKQLGIGRKRIGYGGAYAPYGSMAGYYNALTH